MVPGLDLWEVRTLHGGLGLELRGGVPNGMRTKPALVIAPRAATG